MTANTGERCPICNVRELRVHDAATAERLTRVRLMSPLLFGVTAHPVTYAAVSALPVA